MSGRRLLLVTADLMVGSRVAGLARGCDATVVQRPAPDASGGPFDAVFLDLQAVGMPPATAVARLGEALPAERRVPIVAFGPHVATDLLAAARAAGVDEVVSRGELLGSFAAILGRWCR